jgi:hypothetical protein
MTSTHANHGGDIIRTIRNNIQYIGHFHTAGNPGRHELDSTQELNYKAIAQAIVDLGFTGTSARIQSGRATRLPASNWPSRPATCKGRTHAAPTPRFPDGGRGGPTGTGKSELALRIAAEFQGEIVNCDSLSFTATRHRHGEVPLRKEAASPIICWTFSTRMKPSALESTPGAHAESSARLRRATAAGVVGGTGFYCAPCWRDCSPARSGTKRCASGS